MSLTRRKVTKCQILSKYWSLYYIYQYKLFGLLDGDHHPEGGAECLSNQASLYNK